MLLWYMLIYGSGRFIIEQLREDSLYLGGLRASRVLSLILCGLAAAVLLWRACGGRRKAYAVALPGAAALVARWYALDNPWLYGALLLAGTLCCLALARFAGAARSGRRALWLLPPLLPDAAGLVLSAGALLSFAPRLQTLLCSLTLPMYIGFMVSALLFANDKREGGLCPSES